MASLNSNTRTTATEVKEIFDTELADTVVNQFINMAAEIVDDVAANSNVSTQRLTLIEMNLAAHYASSIDPRVSSEKAGDITLKYRGDMEITEYLRTARSLDPTGIVTLENKPRAGITVLDSRNISD